MERGLPAGSCPGPALPAPLLQALLGRGELAGLYPRVPGGGLASPRPLCLGNERFVLPWWSVCIVGDLIPCVIKRKHSGIYSSRALKWSTVTVLPAIHQCIYFCFLNFEEQSCFHCDTSYIFTSAYFLSVRVKYFYLEVVKQNSISSYQSVPSFLLTVFSWRGWCPSSLVASKILSLQSL